KSGFCTTTAPFRRTWSVHYSFFFFSSRRRHTRSDRDWSSDVCSSDEVERVLHRSLEIERQLAAQPVQVPERLHETGRIRPELRGVAVGEVEPAVEEHEPVREGLLPLAPLGGAATRERLLAARDEPLRHPVDDPRVQIVVAHEALDAERRLVVLVTEVLGDPRLEVAREDVVLMAREEVELVAHAPEERQRAIRRRLLARRDEPLVGELAQRAGAELRLAEPHGRVHVAQATRRLLDV